MSPAEALTVKPEDILTSIYDTARYQEGEEFVVKFLHRYKSNDQHDMGVDLISLRNGNEILSNLNDFVFADVTKSWRTSLIWKDYIKKKYIPPEDMFLDYINSLNKKIQTTRSQVQKDFYNNEIEASKVLMDIVNGHRNKYGIEICVTQ